MTAIENKIHVYFTERFGNNLQSRFAKLNEEFKELNEAFEIYQNATDPRDRMEKAKHLLDELSDVETVLSHISSILNTDHETLLVNALVKSKVREVNPSYMKSV